MKVLSFAPGNKHYDLLSQALVFSPEKVEKADLASYVKLTKKLKAIGTVKNVDPKPEDILVYHAPNGGEVVLEDAEFAILKRHFDATIPTFHKAIAEEVFGCAEWLDALPSVTPEEYAATKKPALVE